MGKRGFLLCVVFFVASLAVSAWLLSKASAFRQAELAELAAKQRAELAGRIPTEYKRFVQAEYLFGRRPGTIPREEIEEEIAWRCGVDREAISDLLDEASTRGDDLLSIQADLISGDHEKAVFDALRLQRDAGNDRIRKRQALESESHARFQHGGHAEALEAAEAAAGLYDSQKESEAWVEAQCLVGLMLLANDEAGEADALAWRLKALLGEHPSVAPVIRVGVFELQAATAEAAGAVSTRKSALRAALAAKESHLGPDHPDLAKMMGRVADLIGGDEAEALTARQLGILEKAYGAADPRVRKALAMRGIALFKVGKREEALAFLERSITGEIGLDDLLSLRYLGCLRRERGEFELAEEAFRRERAMLAKDGNQGYLAQQCDFNLATVLEAAGNQETAAAIFRGLADAANSWANQDDDALVWLHHYAATLKQQGFDREAEPLLARVERAVETRLDKDGRFFLSSAISSASLSAENGRETVAAEYLQIALQQAYRFEKKTGNPFPGHVEALDAFRGLLGNTGKSSAEIDAVLVRMRRDAGLE